MNHLILYRDSPEHIYLEIEKALQFNCINQQRVDSLYYEIDSIALQLTKYFNKNNSTSISRKTFLRIMKTINYMFMHGFHQSMDKYNSLKHNSIQTYYDLGLTMVEQDLVEIKELYQFIQQTELPIINEHYTNIIHHQLPKYLSNLQGYHAIFYYCTIDEDLDYPLIDGLPLYHDMYQMQGTDLTLYFLQRFHLEQVFCNYFKLSLPKLIYQYEVLKGIQIEFIPINILELLFNQIIANYILSQKLDLFLHEEYIPLLQTRLEKSNPIDIVDETLNFLENFFSNDIIEYLNTYKEVFIQNLTQFIAYDFECFIYEKSYEEKQKVSLIPPISNLLYQSVLSQLQNLSTTKEKINFLTQQKLSIYDLIDLLESETFYNEEYIDFYSNLSFDELGILLQLLHRELFVFHQFITMDESFFEELDTSIPWVFYLIEYLHSLNQNQIHEIEEMINSLVIKE